MKRAIGRHHVLLTVIVVAVIAIAAAFFFAPAHAIHERTYLVTSGTDATANNTSSLAAADITALAANDTSRYTSAANWPKSASGFNEAKYIEFVLAPDVPLDAQVQSISLTNVYSRSNTLTAAKLEVWDGTNWSHSHALTIPSAANTDASDTIDLSSYINTPAKVDGLKVRFLAYRSDNGNTKTSHNFLQLHVTFQFAPTVVSVSITPTGPKTNDTLTANVVAVDPDGEPLTTHYQWKKNGSNVGADAATLDLSQAGYGDKSDQMTVLVTVDDGHGGTAEKLSDPVTVLNSPPVVTEHAATTTENTPVAIDVAGTDPDSDTLTYHIVTPPALGTTTISGGVITYTPNSYCNGGDSFVFEADDGTAHSEHTLVSVNIAPVNYPPVAVDQTANTTEHTPVTIILPATDPDNDTLTYSIAAPPGNGTLSDIFEGNKVTYTPAGHFFGTDTFQFKAVDPSLASSTATVTVTVAEVNDAPVATDGAAAGDEDTPIAATLNAADPKGTPLTYEIVAGSGPSHGMLEPVSGNTVTYVPHSNYNGADSFLFKAYDGIVYSNIAQESITVHPVNDPPTLAPIHDAIADEGAPFELTAAATDPDSASDTLRYSLTAGPAAATIDAVTGHLIWTPGETDGPGAHPFTVSVTDGSLATTTSFTLTVNEVNVAPVADDVAVTTSLNTPVSFDLAGSDADLPANTLTYSLIDDPRHGTLARTGQRGITYTPYGGFQGSDSFRYTINDGTTDAAVATVSITVQAGSAQSPGGVVYSPARYPDIPLGSTPPRATTARSAATSTSTATSTISTAPTTSGAVSSSASSTALPPGVEPSWLVRAIDVMGKLKSVLEQVAKFFHL